MATAFRILLWAVVLLAPGGILLAPLLAAHELRRRNRVNREAVSPAAAVQSSVASVAAVAESPAGQLAA